MLFEGWPINGDPVDDMSVGAVWDFDIGGKIVGLSVNWWNKEKTKPIL